MEMNTPIGTNALDVAQGIVGKPLDRVDGRLKVTGGARYAYEVMQGPTTTYGYVVEASIGKGRIKSIDTRAAEQAPGVLLVLTHRSAPAQGTGNHHEAHPVLTSSEVSYYGQPVAFVVAETFEQARAAAYLVRVRYDQSPGKYVLRDSLDRARAPRVEANAVQSDSAVGDFAGAFAAAGRARPEDAEIAAAEPRHDGTACHAGYVGWRQAHTPHRESNVEPGAGFRRPDVENSDR